MRVSISILAALALAGCQSINTNVKTVDDAVQANLPAACTTLAALYTGYVTVNAATPVKASIANKVTAAMAGVQSICDNPTAVTTANAIIVVANAYASVAAALREAEKAGG